jgi:hypothetical protein
MLMDTETASTPPAQDFFDNDSVSWQASEYLHHQKSAGWYLTAFGAIVFASVVAYVITRDMFGPGSVVALGALMLVAAGRRPRIMNYIVDLHGIVVGSKEHSYDDFQSFSVVREDAVESIMLIPQKRFMPNINLYFGPNEAQRVFDILSEHLPLEDKTKDNIDRFLHKIRF